MIAGLFSRTLSFPAAHVKAIDFATTGSLQTEG
jgi:hypothetical protein